MSSVLSIGEAMVELRATPTGFDAGVAGDAFNTAAWLARGGVAVTHAQDLGDDLLFTRLRDAFTARGIAWHGRRLAGAANGMYVVDVDDAGERRFQYFRAGSAAGRTVDPGTFPALQAAAAEHDLLLLTGVTVAICGDDDALDRLVGAHALPLALAWNVRAGLHRRTADGAIVDRDACEVGRCLEAFSQRASVVLASEDDLALGLPGRDAAALAAGVVSRGGVLVLTRGARGARVWHDGGVHDEPAVAPTRLCDTTGAGDAFAAGFLTRWLRGDGDARAAARAGAELAAEALACAGALPPL